LYIISIKTVEGSATVQLTISNFVNPSHRQYDDNCCVPSYGCFMPCSLVYVVCFNSNSGDADCSMQTKYSYLKTPFTVTQSFNPSTVSSIPVTIIVYDVDSSGLSMVDYFLLNVSDTVTLSANYSTTGQRTNYVTFLYATVNITCDDNFYGLDCATYCKPTDDCSGHYTCQAITGSKICISGWTGDQCTVSNVSLCPSIVNIPPALTSSSCSAIDLVFVLQSSKNAPSFHAFAKAVIEGIIDTVNLGSTHYQIAVVTFADTATLTIKLKDVNSKASLKTAINTTLLLMGSKVNLRRGLSVARTQALSIDNGMRPLAYKAVVVLWDGYSPNPEFGTLTDEASRLKTTSSVISVFVVNNVSNALSTSIASDNTHILINLNSNYVAVTTSLGIQQDCSRATAVAGSSTVQPTSLYSKEKPLPSQSFSASNQPLSSYQQVTASQAYSLSSQLPFSALTSQPVTSQGSYVSDVFESPSHNSSTVTVTVTPSTISSVTSYTPTGDSYCSSHGTCSSLNGSCCCEPGFTGDHCEYEYSSDPCGSMPCLLGQCTSNGFSYDCLCPPGVSGKNCDVIGADINLPVMPQTCNISCPSAPCAEFYYGLPNCSIFCRPRDSCLGHYTCSRNGTKECLDGWSGINCTISTLTNSSDCTCQEGFWLNGTCLNSSIITTSTSGMGTTVTTGNSLGTTAAHGVTTATIGSLATTTTPPTTLTTMSAVATKTSDLITNETVYVSLTTLRGIVTITTSSKAITVSSNAAEESSSMAIATLPNITNSTVSVATGTSIVSLGTTTPTNLTTTTVTSKSRLTTTLPATAVTTAAPTKSIEQLIEYIQANFPDMSPDDQLQLLSVLLQN
jgi:hypothetical protein